VVIALVHAGGECRHFGDPDDLTECNPDSEIFELAKALPEHALDLIVGGHTHAPIAHRVHGIPIIESFANARAFGRVDLTVDVSSGRVVEAQIFAPHTLCLDELGTPICTHESYEGTPVTRDAKVSTAIAADLEAASAERSRPLGVSVVSEVTRSSTAESPLGNLLADLMLKAFPGADAAFNNSSSVRTALAPGPLTYGRIFEMFPFDNALATLRLPAATLALLISESLTGAHSFLSLAGLRANAHCEGERLVVELTQPNGQPLPAEKMLTIVTSDFLASHGEGLLNPLSLPEGNLQVHRDRLMRDALVTGLQSFPNQRLDGRDPALFDTEHPRVRYSGRRPLRCGAAPPAAPPAPLP
jgi:5'-nucleotidase